MKKLTLVFGPGANSFLPKKPAWRDTVYTKTFSFERAEYYRRILIDPKIECDYCVICPEINYKHQITPAMLHLVHMVVYVDANNIITILKNQSEKEVEIN